LTFFRLLVIIQISDFKALLYSKFSSKILEPKRTPLYEIHRSLKAKFVDFAGWLMPVEYSGVIEEHLRVRTSCGLFDVSHMGEVEVAGPGALDAVQRLITNDMGRIGDGGCQYTLLCRPDGGVVDDCIVYRFSRERFLFIANASNTQKVFEWMRGQVPAASVLDRSGEFAMLAVQGPSSVEVMRPLMEMEPASIKGFHFVEAKIKGAEAVVSRTGYTGEDGFEVYIDPKDAPGVWKAVMDSGARFGMLPVGLGARDTLRLEMGYPLYGHELTDETTPIEAGLNRFVSLDKPDFIGKGAIEAQALKGVEKTLVGFELLEAGVPRAGYEINLKGTKAGFVTSGTLSPVLKKGIGMAYVIPGAKTPGTEIEVIIRKRAVRARVRKTPFYRRKLFEKTV